MTDWTNVYQQNPMAIMNNLNMNPNSPIDQIQMMAVGGGQNNNQIMEDENFNAMNQMRSLNRNQIIKSIYVLILLKELK